MAQATVFKGQEFHGYIREQHGVHDAIRITYVGMFPELRLAYLKKIRACADDAAADAVVQETIQTLVRKWNLEYPANHPSPDKAGKPVPITVEGVADVMPHVRDKMIAIITWQVASDIDPALPIADRLKAVNQAADSRSLAEIMTEAEQEMRGN